MKIIKYIFAALGILLVVVLLTGLMLPKEYSVSREVTINRSKADVYNYARMLKHQHDYSVWWKMDPNQVTTYTGEDGTVGFIAAWKSELDSVGSGEEEIVAMLAFAVCLLARTPSRTPQRTRAHAVARIHARACRCLHPHRRIRTQHLSHTLSV